LSLNNRLATIFEKVFGIDPADFSLDTVPEDVLRWDSLGHMSLVMELEDTWNLHFEVDEITEMSSARKIVEILQAKGVAD
jgi:acyl carrier protein